MNKVADLHIHSIYSDGVLSPSELISKLSAVGVSVVSITDHDTVGSVQEAIVIGKKYGIEVVPGVEISSLLGDKEVHILGYFIDYKNKDLLEKLEIYRVERIKRAQRIVEKLNRLNIPIKIETVLATSRGDSVGRPHIAEALVNEGHTCSFKEAFDKYIGDGKPAFERKNVLTPLEAISLINATGGLSFLAHPGNNIDDDTLIQLIEFGLDGIEVYHPNHSREEIEYYRGIVNEYCLLECGGSDFHGGLKGDDNILGKFTVSTKLVDNMKLHLSKINNY